jgi:hypothetical protein
MEVTRIGYLSGRVALGIASQMRYGRSAASSSAKLRTVKTVPALATRATCGTMWPVRASAAVEPVGKFPSIMTVAVGALSTVSAESRSKVASARPIKHVNLRLPKNVGENLAPRALHDRS